MIFHNMIRGNDIPTFMISELLKETPHISPLQLNDPIEYFSNIVNQIEFIKELLSFQITKITYCLNCINRIHLFSQYIKYINIF